MTDRGKWLPIKGECPACGRGEKRSANWCGISQDGLIISCHWAASNRPIKKRDGEIVYLHAVSACNGGAKIAVNRNYKPAPKLTRTEIKSLSKRFAADLGTKYLAALIKSLEPHPVSEESLCLMGVGWSVDPPCWTFPMKNGQREVIGFRTRFANGDKKSWLGSSNGLFIPINYQVINYSGILDQDPALLILPEGPTSCAAALDMGYRAVGRPNNSGGGPMLVQLLESDEPQNVVVFADRDGPKAVNGSCIYPGIEGALATCDFIRRSCATLQYLYPAEGVKDLREWMVKEKNSRVIDAAIANAPAVTPAWLKLAHDRVAARRREWAEKTVKAA